MNSRPPLAERLKSSLTEGMEFARGEKKLAATLVPATREYTSEEVSEIRHSRGFTQVQFAILLGVNVRTLQSWEQGLRRPSRPTMRLLQVFDQPEAFREVLSVEKPLKRSG